MASEGKHCISKYVTQTKYSGIWKIAFTSLMKSLISGVTILLTNDSIVKLFWFRGWNWAPAESLDILKKLLSFAKLQVEVG